MPKAWSLLRFGINCVKSDNFRSKRPEYPSRRPFSAVSGRNVIGVNGTHPPEGGLSNGAGIAGFHGLRLQIMSGQNWQEWPLNEGFTQEGKSLSLKF